MEEACEIARLPEELLSAALARTTPRDACRAAAVSPAFRAAADSDDVWAGFLPPGGLPPLADGEPPAPAPPSSKKELFLRLSAGPALLQDKLVSVWLDRETGAKCYMLSARNLFIVWGNTPEYWTWIPLEDSRFSEGAELVNVCWFEIHGKIHGKMLSQGTTYAAYMVFKMDENSYGLNFPVQEASVSSGATNLTRKVCLQADDGDEDEYEYVEEEDEEDDEEEEDEDEDDDDEYYRALTDRRVVSHKENVTFPQKRADGWLELELGEFLNEGGDDGEVSISLTETKSGRWKSGLIVQGIEIRHKKSG
ncbi:hypothetical protein CFC21_094517 [Triticum aestivum]|uniref:F-box domain-containing protein n=2 Tax=Triticum aestivum TaxID=4565 RepID=A0A3B6QNT9_WHEAT|nr:F-box protein PP2-B11-like [Triticum aestivum]KAF7091984.1 hypothetical protein CFC21_094517 [Triticum aestivum]